MTRTPKVRQLAFGVLVAIRNRGDAYGGNQSRGGLTVTLAQSRPKYSLQGHLV